mgnify:FL=1
MSKIMKLSNQAAVSDSGSGGKKTAVGVILLLVALGAIGVCPFINNLRHMRAVDNEAKQLMSPPKKAKFEKLPMVEQYVDGSLKKTFLRANGSDNAKQMDYFLKKVDKAKLAALIDKVAVKNYDRDWSTAVAHLDKEQRATYSMDVLSKPTINFQDVKACGDVLGVLTRWSAREGNVGKTTIRLFLAHLSLFRQFLSYVRGDQGVTVISAMILLNSMKTMNEVLTKTKYFNSFSKDFFFVIKDRFEAVDGLLPMVGDAAKLEMTSVKGFFDFYNKKANKSLLMPKAAVDEKWLAERARSLYPANEVFTMPFVETREEFAQHKARAKKLFKKIGSSVYKRGLFSPEKAFAEMMLALTTANMERCYKKECMARVRLRTMYLAFAVAHKRQKLGRTPSSLAEVRSLVKPQMMINPFTGKNFGYEASGGKVKISGHNGDKETTFIEF